MKNILIYFTTFFFIANSYSQIGPVNEVYDVVKIEHEITDFYPKHYISDNTYTPITTYKGNVYFVYIDSKYRPKIGKIEKGKVSTVFLDNKKPIYRVQLNKSRGLPDGHQKFSIGIDKEGYIHVVGDMHNYGSTYNSTKKKYSTYVNRYFDKHILYWVSEKPEKIDSFIFEGNDEYANEKVSTIPGNGFTYSSIYNDMDGELYVSHRARISKPGHYDGEMIWALAKYDVDNRRWVELGGLAPSYELPRATTAGINSDYDPIYKAVFWENNGISTEKNKAVKNWYQPFYGDIVYFDFNDRMHAVTQINNNNFKETSTDVLYAYSDNKGKTFNKVNNSQISQLPIRAQKGPNQGSIVAGESESLYGYAQGPSVSANKEGSPIIAYTKLNKNKGKKSYNMGTYKYWNKKNKKWSEELLNPTGGLIRHNVVTDANGIITFIGPDLNGWIVREFGFTKTAKQNRQIKALKGFFSGIDRKGIVEQNAIRGFLYDKRQGTLKIVKTEGIPVLTPISKEWKVTYLNSAFGESGMFNDIFQLKSTGVFGNKISGEYVNQVIKGNFEIEARIINVNYVSDASFAGLMIKDNHAKNSAHFGVAVTSYEGIKTVSKGAKNDAISITKGYQPSEWLKIKRVGDLLESYRSDNGKTWKKITSRKIKMNDTVICGLIAGSGNVKEVGHARVDHVSVKKIVK